MARHSDTADLTDRQRRFVDEYLVDLNGAAAARRAGYSERRAKNEAVELLDDPRIQAAVKARIEERKARIEVTQDQVIYELARLAFSDIRKAIGWRSNVLATIVDEETGQTHTTFTNTVELKNSDEIDDDTAAAISEISQTDKGALRIKFHDKKGALTDLGRHFGLFTDTHKHEVGDSLAQLIARIDGRTRSIVPGGDK